jgi:hypothetical protein
MSDPRRSVWHLALPTVRSICAGRTVYGLCVMTLQGTLPQYDPTVKQIAIYWQHRGLPTAARQPRGSPLPAGPRAPPAVWPRGPRPSPAGGGRPLEPEGLSISPRGALPVEGRGALKHPSRTPRGGARQTEYHGALFTVFTSSTGRSSSGRSSSSR